MRDYIIYIARMRTASVLLVTLRGLSTEVAKNIVLAGIGKLTVVDSADVSPEDLGSGFFFRDEDVGKKVGLKSTWLSVYIFV
jgi:ubiquitin-like 1-activating enzyme E1 A